MNGPNTGLPEVFRTRDFVGWDVVDNEGEKAGTVADLLIDSGGRVRYVDVEFGFPRKHILLPQERLQWGEGRLIVDGWIRRGIGSLPPYDPSQPLHAPALEEMRRAYPGVYDPEGHDWRAPVTETRVVPLSEAKDFRLEKGAPDLRGWNVFGSDGERIGTVSQLLVDPSALKVRYVDVDVHQDLYLLTDDRHVLVPLEFVELRERGKDIWVEDLTAAQVAALPAYTGGAVNPVMERAVQDAFPGAGARARLESGAPPEEGI